MTKERADDQSVWLGRADQTIVEDRVWLLKACEGKQAVFVSILKAIKCPIEYPKSKPYILYAEFPGLVAKNSLFLKERFHLRYIVIP